MRPFNLEEYLANPSKKLVTRDRKEARIVCSDRKTNEGYPILALVKIDNIECCYSYTKKGEFTANRVHTLDLFFADEIPDFKPYDRVLTRGHSGLPWKANLFSNFKMQGNNTIAVCLKGDYLLGDIIPFDENKVGKIGLEE